ncbi:MAG: DUF1559 domain-containing protein [Gemmataceae bacterium]|nr:DUF1559 domain-containing protein [Gemmataceae bacterium]
MAWNQRSAFSLVELLTAIAILAVLVGLTLAGVQRARNSAARARCLNNLRQLGLALHQYDAAHRILPEGWTNDTKTKKFPYLGWPARLLPYLEQQPLWDEVVRAYDADPDPYSPSFPSHAPIRATPVPAFTCPLDPRGPTGVPVGSTQTVAFLSYLGNLGTSCRKTDGVLYANSAVRLTDVADGTSQTLLLGERPPSADRLYGWWYRGVGQNMDGSVEVVLGTREVVFTSLGSPCPPGPHHFGPGDLNRGCDEYHFWSFHPGGAHFAFCDGSVRFLAYSADPVMPALATRAGHEAVPLPD